MFPAGIFGIDSSRSPCVECNLVSTQVPLDCGHKLCIHCFWKKSSSSSCCNLCWKFSHLKTLQHDMVMYPEREGMCDIHQEEQKYFCCPRKTLLCVSCAKSEQHRNHTHWPIAVAALKYREEIQARLSYLDDHLKKLQEVQKFSGKEKHLSWVVECSDYRNGSAFDLKDQEVLKHEKGKEKKSKQEEFVLEEIKEKFSELYQKLKKTEAIQECKILEQKKEWEADIAGEIRFLTDNITELQESSQKPNLEMLKDAIEPLNRTLRQYTLEPFIPRMDISYVDVVADFLKFYHRFKLLENCNYYDLADDKGRTIIFRTDSSGSTSTIYTTGHVKAEATNGTQFLDPWYQDLIIDREGCVRTITIMSDFTLRDN